MFSLCEAHNKKEWSTGGYLSETVLLIIRQITSQ